MANQLNSFESAVLRLLEKRLADYLAANIQTLSYGGDLVVGNVHATAQNYSSSTAYIRALRDVLALCKEVEDEMLGRTPDPSEAHARR